MSVLLNNALDVKSRQNQIFLRSRAVKVNALLGLDNWYFLSLSYAIIYSQLQQRKETKTLQQSTYRGQQILRVLRYQHCGKINDCFSSPFLFLAQKFCAGPKSCAHVGFLGARGSCSAAICSHKILVAPPLTHINLIKCLFLFKGPENYSAALCC